MKHDPHLPPSFISPEVNGSRAARLESAFARVREELLKLRSPAGYWTGELSSSALSTATAVAALSISERNGATIPKAGELIENGLAWLGRNRNADGGWGDTIRSRSNISTTTLCWAAFGAAPGADQRFESTVAQAEKWLSAHAGGIEPRLLAAALLKRYGKDRTFSAPILTMCALAGRLGQGRAAWELISQLPFELAACPREWFAALRLPVVSYALPALIAIGQVRHYFCPTRNPINRLSRRLAWNRTMRVLEEVQPAGGGFLEATPLTSFVTMSLAASGRAHHAVVQRALAFLVRSAQPDGSWQIDTNLATWVTTLSINALAGEQGESNISRLPSPPDAARGTLRLEPELQVNGRWDFTNAEKAALSSWLLRQQYREPHPYTNAPPGGWAWTDLSGGVPDADDTAGALLALYELNPSDAISAAELGVEWLLNLQNSDGGIPTFCRGWGRLPFDRSSPDLTAHALRAWAAWLPLLNPRMRKRIKLGVERAIAYLARTQREDGSWVPLWFGNEHDPAEENPTYGTARVLLALAGLNRGGAAEIERLSERAVRWLVKTQNVDGSWSGSAIGPGSLEESAVALEALAAIDSIGQSPRVPDREWASAIARGADWLLQRIELKEWNKPAPIGFYFAKLWYFEKLYPLIFSAGALRRLHASFRPIARARSA